jgi:predicted negative regulator of RcsB-dependent stress response
MKTERRHELETNVLATSLAHGAERVKPYGRGVLAAIIAALFIVLAWWYISVQNTSQSAVAWDEYLQAVSTGTRDEQLLEDIAQQNAGSTVANMARLTLADWKLDAGTNRLLTDRAAATEQLREASETFRALQSVNDPSIQERAGYGLARTYEAMGELDKARTAYTELAEKFPEGPFVAAAKSRAAKLEEHGTKDFYDWLAKYEPPAAMSGEPGTPGARPDFLKEPDAGSLKVPSSLSDPAALPNLGVEPAAATPAETAPAEEAKPAEAAPAAETPQ